MRDGRDDGKVDIGGQRSADGSQSVGANLWVWMSVLLAFASTESNMAGKARGAKEELDARK